MKRLLLVAALAGTLGCVCKPDPLPQMTPSGEIWDNSGLLTLNPNSVRAMDIVNIAQIKLDDYWVFNQSHGIIYPGLYASTDHEYPTRFAGGGDSALFTGFALAAFCYRFQLTGRNHKAIETLKGLYWLTHAAGRGVICRAVIPYEERSRWDYPAAWQSRIDSGFSERGLPIKSPWGGEYPISVYYTRATRDQLTGILYGLSVAWAHLPSERDKIETIVKDLYDHLKLFDWRIRDFHGKNDTSADKVDGLLKAQFLALLRKIDPVHEEEYQSQLKSSLNSITNIANLANNYKQYYAHNLRAARLLSIWTLEENEETKIKLAAAMKDHVWKYTKNHQNAWFSSIMYHMHKEDRYRVATVYSLRSQALKPVRGWGSPLAGLEREPSLRMVLNGCAKHWVLPPHLRKPTNYFIWTKRPWDAGHLDKNGYLHEPGLDFLLPYWLVSYERLNEELHRTLGASRESY